MQSGDRHCVGCHLAKQYGTKEALEKALIKRDKAIPQDILSGSSSEEEEEEEEEEDIDSDDDDGDDSFVVQDCDDEEEEEELGSDMSTDSKDEEDEEKAVVDEEEHIKADNRPVLDDDAFFFECGITKDTAKHLLSILPAEFKPINIVWTFTYLKKYTPITEISRDYGVSHITVSHNVHQVLNQLGANIQQLTNDTKSVLQHSRREQLHELKVSARMIVHISMLPHKPGPSSIPQNYSVMHRSHGYKFETLVDFDGRPIRIMGPFPGAMNHFEIMNKTNPYELLGKNEVFIGDICKGDTKIITPFIKRLDEALTPVQEAQNKFIHYQTSGANRFFQRLKEFKAVTDLWRLDTDKQTMAYHILCYAIDYDLRHGGSSKSSSTTNNSPSKSK
ncbi:hypothetical protein SAMD00019534_091450 [Acytostelium subglobosum LB1]|uniref:hypothetical protein n=1 Tax=Acytostelium subglobosum LB1 TaxID=1410327 RepID=UPI0006451F73|nr:hypothetical protein SAMD00019534_091450 [Acytostelium subglobosum LB1]GAM25970.1 hypothetical protein SAMD00019534_091450 [Acytostelium subglobosum LB1]|eukprot:XP_012751013.1 hypothetical protein SAMD00019534_091450 [Acytostelium subglobosum LB1]